MRGRVEEQFQRFGVEQCRGSSDLYERLSLGIASDPELVAFAMHALPGQPTPNLVFGAVQYLLLQGADKDLEDVYIQAASAAPSPDSYRLFRAFCLRRAAEIADLISCRLVQTNEVGRCACILPALDWVDSQERRSPLYVIEVGASAGLNLLWPQYFYDYGSGRVYGDPGSPVRLICSLRGPRSLGLSQVPPTAGSIGIDVNPLRPESSDDQAWLRALIWPEHVDRAKLLDAALTMAAQDPPEVIRSNAVDVLPEVVGSAPQDSAVCVLCAFVLNQFDEAALERFYGILRESSYGRHISCVLLDRGDGSGTPLRVIRFREGFSEERLLAICHPHGRWLEWTG
ncbi:MAG: DUF2332 domain-containing protein [Chloroflexota bacterium]